jgi:hypothetical protein
MITHDQAKRAATRIVERLRALGVDVKNAHGYQAVAAYHDYPDWNRFNAAISSNGRTPGGNASSKAAPPVDTATLTQLHRLHQGQCDSRYHILLGGPGTGKTTALWMKALVEAGELNGTFLFVVLAGENLVPRQLADTTHRINITTAADPETPCSASIVDATSPRASGALVNLHLPGGVSHSETKASSKCFFNALSQLPEILTKLLPAEFLESVSLICLDETQRVGGALEAQLFASIIPRWQRGQAEILIATQMIEGGLLDISAHGRPHVIAMCTHMWELYEPAFVQHDRPELTDARQLLFMMERGHAPEIFGDDTLLVDLIAAIVHGAIQHTGFTNWANSKRATLLQTLLEEVATARKTQVSEQLQNEQWPDGTNKGFVLTP